MACGCCEDADLGKKLEVARVTPELLHVHGSVELHLAIAPHPITRINRVTGQRATTTPKLHYIVAASPLLKAK
jgi:hypothetical protein